MKTKFLKLTLFIVLAISFASCNEAKKDSNDPKDKAEEHNDAKFDKAKEKDAQFIVDAAEMELVEIKMAELAEKEASDKEVRELGKLLKDEHQKSFKKLKELAEKKMITIPEEITEKGKNSYNKLSDKKEKEFDKAYCEKTVESHEDAIKKFEKCTNNCEDYEIKTWANEQLKTLREHLDKSMDCRDKTTEKDEKNNKQK